MEPQQQSLTRQTAAPETLAAPKPAARAADASRRRQYNAVMRGIRRLHMYFGLFLIPWVLVYAVTGFLLNHHTIWPDAETRPVGRDQVRGTALENLPTALGLAQEVTAALNTRAGSNRYTLANPRAVQFDSPTISLEGKSGDRSVSLILDPSTGTGYVELSTPQKEMPAPFDAEKDVFGKRRPADEAAGGAQEVFNRLGMPVKKAEASGMPSLLFTLTDAAGKAWKVRYDPKSGSVKGRPTNVSNSDEGAKQFLYNLHFSHGYPQSAGVRMAWAVFVDLTALTLMFWCLSGMFMWWQMKVVRKPGLAVLAASVLTAASLGVFMYRMVYP